MKKTTCQLTSSTRITVTETSETVIRHATIAAARMSASLGIEVPVTKAIVNVIAFADKCQREGCAIEGIDRDELLQLADEIANA